MYRKLIFLIGLIVIFTVTFAITFNSRGGSIRIYVNNWCDLDHDQFVKISINGKTVHDQHVEQNLITHRFSHKFKVLEFQRSDKLVKVEILNMNLVEEILLPRDSSDYIFVQIALDCIRAGPQALSGLDTTREGYTPYFPDYEAEPEPLISIYGMSRKNIRKMRIPGL